MVRLVLSFACLGAWLGLLFVGWAMGGLVHLLLVAALATFPWREALAPVPEDP